MSLQVRVLSDVGQLGPCLSHWARLAPTPMQSPEWLLGWWSAYKTENCQLQIVVCLLDGSIVGIAPLFLRHSWSLGATLGFLGSGKACTDFQTILAEPEQQDRVTAAVCDWLSDSCYRGLWGLCDWDGISSHDPVIHRVFEEFTESGMLVRSHEKESTWRLDMSGGWDGVLARMSKTQRRQSRNLINRLDKSGRYQVCKVESAEEIPEALERFIDLHQMRWAAVGEPGCFSEPRFVRFINASCIGLAAKGQCHIRNLRCDGQVVASQLILRDDAGDYMYQTGRDPAFDHAKVGRILNLATIRSLCQTRAGFLDYLRGDEIYKSRLGAQATGLARVRIVKPDTRGHMQHMSGMLGSSMKRTVVRLAGAAGMRRPECGKSQTP